MCFRKNLISLVQLKIRKKKPQNILSFFWAFEISLKQKIPNEAQRTEQTLQQQSAILILLVSK